MPVVPSENPARRTFILDNMRAWPGGCLETLAMTFVVLIAVRVFEAEAWQKATLVAASSFGLLLSLFPVQLVRRTGISVNLGTALLWAISAGGLIIAAIGGASVEVFLPAMVIALLCITLSIPLMSQIYRKHYPDRSRGRLFASTAVVRKAAALVGALIFGKVLENDLEDFRVILLVYAGCCVLMGGCVLAMRPVHLQKSTHVRLFGALGHLRSDLVFRSLIISWMILGFGNLLCWSIFVEYVSNPAYGYELTEFMIAVITGSLPEIMFLLTVVIWGIVFDRVNFFLVRMILNVFFMCGVLFYFFGEGTWALCVGVSLHGIGRAGGNIAWSLWVTKFAQADQVAEYMSVHTFMCGVRGVIAPFVAFPMIALLGPRAVGGTGFILMLIATLMIWPHIRKKTPVGIREETSRVG